MKKTKTIRRITAALLVAVLLFTDCGSRWLQNGASTVQAEESLGTADGPDTYTDYLTKAEELGTPLAIYNYLRNSMNYEYYSGRRKGPEAAYDSLGGNDADQALLLSDMLRAAGCETRFVKGRIRLTLQEAQALTGAQNPEAAADILAMSGSAFLYRDSHNSPLYVETDHIWVEALVPYGDYRGAGRAEGEMLWIPLDTGIKEYEETDSVYDHYKEYGLTADAWKETAVPDMTGASVSGSDPVGTVSGSDPVGTVSGSDPAPTVSGSDPVIPLPGEKDLADLQGRMEELLLENPGSCLARRTIRRENLPYLPLSLPYQVVEKYGTYDTLDSVAQDSISFSLNDHDLATVTPAQIYNRRLMLLYMPEAGGVKAQLTLDGEVLGEGFLAVPAGTKETFTMQIYSAGESHTVTNSLTAGGIYQITADTQAITSRELTTALENLKTASASVTEENVLSDNYLGALLDCMGKTYFSQVDIADRLLAEQLSVPTSRSLSVGMTGYVPATGQLFLDIDHDVHMVSANGEKERQFLLLSGMISSAYEGIVLEQFTGIPSVSTMSLLAQAAEQGMGTEILTAADYEEKKAGLALPDSTLAAMEQEIAAGKIVIVPREEQRLMEWQGSGYIVLDRETLAGSYMIEGGLNGGNCGIEVGLMYLSNIILTAADVYDLVSLMAGVLKLCATMTLTPVTMVTLIAVMMIICRMMIVVIDSYLEAGFLIDMYVDGNEAAGEAAKNILVINGIWAAGSWGASGMVRYCSNRAAAGWLKETMGYSSAPRLINALGGDAKTATKVCQSLKRAGFGSEAIADMAERLGRDGTLKLERLASGGLSGDILEALARNEDLLGRYSADTLLSFKGSACAADTVMDFLRQADADGASLYRIYGDKAVDIWKTMDKKGLEGLWNYGDEFLEQYQRRGSEFVQDFLKNGDAALKGSAVTDILKFGENDLVYGPSAGGALRELQQKAGGKLLQDIGSPSQNGYTSWIEFSIDAINRTVENGNKIRFDLTNIDNISDVLNGVGENAYSVTSQEIRYIRDNWSRLQEGVIFYKDGLEVLAPWLEN